MKIEFSKDEYAALVNALAMTGTIYALLGDMVDGEFKKKYTTLERLESNVLKHASEADFNEDIDIDGESLSLSSESGTHEQMNDDLDEFEEWAMYDKLANKLGWRDFLKSHTEEQIETLRKKHGDYLGVPVYDFEKKYYNEFDEHGYDRLEISSNAQPSTFQKD